MQYSYDDNSVAVVNGKYEPLPGIKVLAKIYDLDAREEYSRGITLDVPADSTAKAFDLPKPDDANPTYFLRLELRDAGKLISDNF